MLKNKKIFIYSNDCKFKKDKILEIKKILDESDLKIVSDVNESDIILTIGGDGTLLSAIGAFGDSKKSFFPIGAGTVNFMTSKITDASDLNQDFEIFELPLIEVQIELENGEIINRNAFNDVYFNAPTGKLGYIKVSGEYYLDRTIAGDGLIISTPQGSTGYNLNAGGVTLPLVMGIWSITDINSSSKKSSVIKAQELVIEPTRQKYSIHIDNYTPGKNIKKAILKPSNKTVEIIFLKKENFEKRRYK